MRITAIRNRTLITSRIVSLAIAILPVLLAGGCADISLEEDATQQAAWGPICHGLQARVALAKSRFTMGERIAVTFRVRNASTDPVSVPRWMEMFYQNTHLSFEGEPATGLIGDSGYPATSADFVTLKPGEVYRFPHHRQSMELQVHARRAGRYTFWSTPSFYGPRPTPGGDRVAGVDAWTGLLESNRVRFGVTEDESEALSMESVRRRSLEEARDWLGRDLMELVRQTGAETDRCGSQIPLLISSQQMALVALVWAGDEKACTEAVALLAAAKPDPASRPAGPAGRFPLASQDGSVPPHTMLLLQALERHRPEVARAARGEILALQVPPPRSAWINPRKTATDMTLEELRRRSLIEGGGLEQQEAMRRWLVLDADRARTALREILHDDKRPVAMRAYSAANLASARQPAEGDASAHMARDARQEALDWLRAGCLANLGLGGRPALALLEGGDRGRSEFLKLLEKHDGKNLPRPFAYAVAECRRDTFFEYLDRFLALRNEEARGQAHLRIRKAVLSKEELARLADHVERRRSDHPAVAAAVAHSLARHPPSEPAARQLAGLWVDEMLDRRDPDLWPALAAAFLESGLGNSDRAAAAARHWLYDEARAALACDVLAQAGRLEDLPLIWRCTHRQVRRDGRLEPRIGQVEALSKGWLAAVRLATPTPSPAESTPR